MDTVRIGMVGSGWMAKFYAESIVKYNENVELVGVTGGTRAPKLASEYGVEAMPDLETMLKRDDVDAPAAEAVAHQTTDGDWAEADGAVGAIEEMQQKALALAQEKPEDLQGWIMHQIQQNPEMVKKLVATVTEKLAGETGAAVVDTVAG